MVTCKNKGDLIVSSHRWSEKHWEFKYELEMENLGKTWAPMLLSVLRIMSGLLLLQHGAGKMPEISRRVSYPPTFNLNSMPGYAGVIELVCGILLVLGLFTRPAAFLASGMTAVAYFGSSTFQVDLRISGSGAASR